MIISSVRKEPRVKPKPSSNVFSKKSNTRPARVPLKATQHIGNMSDFFKNSGISCGSCGKGRM